MMELSDEELMLLEQLTYLDDNVARDANNDEFNIDKLKGNTVGEILDKFDPKKLDGAGTIFGEDANGKKGTTYAQGNEWAAIIREIQGNEKLKNLKIEDITKSKDGKKINALVLKDPNDKENSKGIVCFRGTLDGEEWYDDCLLLREADTRCNEDALEFVKKLDFKSITVVGHSKGSNKAAYCYYLLPNVDRCLTMDGPGFMSIFFDKLANDPDYRDQFKEKITSGNFKAYSISWDFVNVMMATYVGAENIFIKGHGRGLTFQENHSPTTFFTAVIEIRDGEPIYVLHHDEDGNVWMKRTEQSAVMKIVHHFTDFADRYMPEDEKYEMADFLGVIAASLMDSNGYVAEDGELYKGTEGAGKWIDKHPDLLTKLIAYITVYRDLYVRDRNSCIHIGDILAGYNKLKFELRLRGINPIIPFIELLTGKDGYDVAKEQLLKKALKVDQKTLDYVKAHFQEEYDKVMAIEGMGSYDCFTDRDVYYYFPDYKDPKKKTYEFPQFPITPSGGESLYFDPNYFNVKKSNIFSTTNELFFDTSAFDDEEKVCGTESMMLLSDYWHKTSETTSNYKDFYTNSVDGSIGQMGDSISNVDFEAANSMEVGN